MNGPSGELPGLGPSIALSFASLGVVCLIAYLALRWLARRGFGVGSAGSRRGAAAIRVVARCTLEPRRSLYVVVVANRCFLLGVGEGPMTMLAELDAAAVDAAPASDAKEKT